MDGSDAAQGPQPIELSVCPVRGRRAGGQQLRHQGRLALDLAGMVAVPYARCAQDAALLLAASAWNLFSTRK